MSVRGSLTLGIPRYSKLSEDSPSDQGIPRYSVHDRPWHVKIFQDILRYSKIFQDHPKISHSKMPTPTFGIFSCLSFVHARLEIVPKVGAGCLTWCRIVLKEYVPFQDIPTSHLQILGMTTCNPGTHLKHLRQAKAAFEPPKHDLHKDFITPISGYRAKTLAKGALHTACKLFAACSVNVKGSDLQLQLQS